MKKNRTIGILIFLILLLFGLVLTGCSSQEPPSQDYSKEDLWLSLPEETVKDVDLFYLYPTAWGRRDDSAPHICQIDYQPMRDRAADIFNVQATAFENTCNIYAPFYRQADAAYCLGLGPEEHHKVMMEAPVPDSIAAFEYYIENYNDGRPFILAGHSQGSNVLLYLLSDYMKENPKVYQRMVAAYVIGYSVTEEYLTANPHLKFAEGPDDTGVIISYNTEAEEIDGQSPVRLPGAVAINPINWKRDGTLARAEESLGEIYLLEDGSFQRIVPGYKDAKVDVSRGAVVCSSVNADDYLSPFPKGVYHAEDYSFYYFNLRANAKERIAAYMGKGYLTKEFNVETDWEYQETKNNCAMDFTMPKVAETVMNSDKINFQLATYNTIEELKEAQARQTTNSQESVKRWYSVSNIDGICSLNLFYEYTLGADRYTDTTCYYYSERKGDILTQEEYLKALGYTKQDILDSFNEKYGEKYSNRTYTFSDLIFYFDEKNQLQFDSQIIDAMVVNYADFNLNIGGKLYGLREERSLPGLDVINTKEQFLSGVWAGSDWLTEYYDGAVALFAYNKETGEKSIFDLELTPSENTKNITTYRGAKLGDNKERILSLYPEFDPEEQLLLHGNANQFTLDDDAYQYLYFFFENDILVKIEVGTVID